MLSSKPAARSLRRNLLRMAGGLALGLLAAEVLLRVLGISYPRVFIPDPDLGMVLEPNFAGTFCKEGKVFVRINSAGFRDRERSLTKPDNVFRIAVLGDSFTEALQVPLEATFCAVLERELNQRLAGQEMDGKQRTCEVLNFGVSGYGTAQELHLLRKHVWNYDPDLVLVMVYPGNDIHNNFKPLEWHHIRPFYYLENGELVLDNSFRENSEYLAMHTPNAQWKRSVQNNIRVLQLASETRVRLQYALGGANENGQEHHVFHPTGPWEEAWTITERLILLMQREVRSRDRAFMVAVADVPIQVYPKNTARAEFCRVNGVEDLLYPDHRLAKLAEGEDFPLVPLAAAMQAEADQRGTYFHGFPNGRLGTGHWNEVGHRFVAERLAEAVTPLIRPVSRGD